MDPESTLNGFSGAVTADVLEGGCFQSLRAADREQIRSITSDPERSADEIVRRLLALGSERLHVQNGVLAHVNAVLGTHTVVETSGASPPARPKGRTTDLEATYCCHLLSSSASTLTIHDAPNEGWDEDRTYDAFGFRCYLGARVLVADHLYGTVCFVDTEAHDAAFEAADAALVEAIGQIIGKLFAQADEWTGTTGPGEHADQEEEADRPDTAGQDERSEEWVQTITENIEEGLYRATPEEGIVYANRPLAELFGYESVDDMQALSPEELYVHPERRAELLQVAEQKEQDTREVQFQRKDGSTFTGRLSGSVTRDEQGNVQYIDGVIADISEAKERERQYRQAVAQLRALFDADPNAVMALDHDGLVQFWNPAAERIFGWSEDEVFGSPLPIVSKEKRSQHEQLRRRVFDGESIEGVEVKRRRKDGTVIDVRISAAPMRPHGESVTGIMAVLEDVTEKKEQERALREERDLLDRVFQTSPTAITLLDVDGNFVRVSDRAQQILGLETEDVTDRAFDDPDWHITAPDGGFLPEDDLPFARVKSMGESVFGLEHAIEWPDGTRRLLSVSGAPLHDDKGTFFGAVFHLDDITERRKAKRNVRKSEQRFRGLFENAALGIALIDEETGEILEANPALASMLEMDRSSLQGTHFEAITHPDDVEADRHLYGELVSGKRDQYQLEKRYVRPSGEAFWGQLTVSRRDSPDGMQVVGMTENIDVEKKRKADLRLFQKMVEQSEDAILLSKKETTDELDSEIVYTNPAFTEMTGYSHDEMIGRTARVLHGPRTDQETLDRLEEELAAGKTFVGEAINYRKNGTPFVNRWNVAPVHDETDTITHWVSVQRDVTEQRRLQERLLEVQEEERRRIDQEIHDEMGGLLTSLQMTVELARLNAQDEGMPLDKLDEIESLVSELASTARTISRKLYSSALSEAGLVDALERIVDDVSTDLDLAVDLRSEIDSDDRYSSLVERTACWIAQEALVNVARHAQTDTARVFLTECDNQLRLQVVDQGIGFDPDLERDEGFGLKGIRRRVERLNGRLDIHTVSGEGTELSVALPLTLASVPR